MLNHGRRHGWPSDRQEGPQHLIVGIGVITATNRTGVDLCCDTPRYCG